MDVKIEEVLRLYIPPLRDHCMSSCKYKIPSLHIITSYALIPLPGHLTSSSLPCLGSPICLSSSLEVYTSSLWPIFSDVYSSFSTFCSYSTTIPNVGEYYHWCSFQFDSISSELHVPIWYAYLLSLVQNFLVSKYLLEVVVD